MFVSWVPRDYDNNVERPKGKRVVRKTPTPGANNYIYPDTATKKSASDKHPNTSTFGEILREAIEQVDSSPQKTTPNENISQDRFVHTKEDPKYPTYGPGFKR